MAHEKPSGFAPLCYESLPAPVRFISLRRFDRNKKNFTKIQEQKKNRELHAVTRFLKKLASSSSRTTKNEKWSFQSYTDSEMSGRKCVISQIFVFVKLTTNVKNFIC